MTTLQALKILKTEFTEIDAMCNSYTRNRNLINLIKKKI